VVTTTITKVNAVELNDLTMPTEQEQKDLDAVRYNKLS
jgi:hypothetical protein